MAFMRSPQNKYGRNDDGAAHENLLLSVSGP
jgi:hypothetical protein